jgi:hypothetical protein
MRRLTFATLAGVTLVGAACASGGVRPSYKPFPQALVDTVNATPAAVIQELATRVSAENMRPNWTSPEEGFLETQWFNVVTQESGVMDRGNPDRYVLIRFWADPAGEGKTQVTAEVVLKRTTDPSVLPRDQEMMAPPGSAGDRLLRRIMEGMKERFGS